MIVKLPTTALNETNKLMSNRVYIVLLWGCLLLSQESVLYEGFRQLAAFMFDLDQRSSNLVLRDPLSCTGGGFAHPCFYITWMCEI